MRTLIVFVLLGLLIVACNSASAPLQTNQTASEPSVDPSSRTFLLGTSQWPPSTNYSAIERMYTFKRVHTDLAVFHQTGGVPWSSLSSNKTLPARIDDEWRTVRNAKGKDQLLFVALTPLDSGRSGLADDATQITDHAALPEDWKNIRLDDRRVKDAYLAYCRSAINIFQPDFLAIGIESNVLLSANGDRFEQYLSLNDYVYTQLKKEYPKMLIFSTVQNEHLLGVIAEAKGKEEVQRAGVRRLMERSDVLALSTYPYGPWQQAPIPASYFDTAVLLAGETKRPIAIAETGYPSKSFNAFGIAFESSPSTQREYLDTLLTFAHQQSVLFVVNWVTVDYDQLLNLMPEEAQDASRYWAYTGLRYANETDKPALAVWDGWLAMPFKR